MHMSHVHGPSAGGKITGPPPRDCPPPLGLLATVMSGTGTTHHTATPTSIGKGVGAATTNRKKAKRRTGAGTSGEVLAAEQQQLDKI